MQSNAKVVRAKKAPTTTQVSSHAENNTTSAATEAETRGSTATQSVNAPATDNSSGTSAPAAKKLSPAEKSLLAQCERTIKEGLRGELEAGKAILTVDDNKLYREKYGDIHDYLQVEWKIGRSHRYRWINYARVMNALSPIGDKFLLPDCESAARPLARLKTAEEIKAAWTAVVDKSGNNPVTAQFVKEVVAGFKPVKAKKAKAEATPAQAEAKTAVVQPPVKEETKPVVNPAPTEQASENEVIDAKTAMKYLAKIEELIEEEYFNEEEADLALKLVKRLRNNIAEELEYDPSMDGEEYNPDPGYIEGDDEFDPDPEYVPDDDCEPDTGESQGEE